MPVWRRVSTVIDGACGGITRGAVSLAASTRALLPLGSLSQTGNVAGNPAHRGAVSVGNTDGHVARELAVRLISVASRPVGKTRLARAIRASPTPYKAEVGSGPRMRPGWLSADVRWNSRLYLDVASEWPIPNDPVSHVYADNVIEHLGLNANRTLFAQAVRVLIPGGRMRLVIPDVGRLARFYVDGGRDAEQHLANARTHGYTAEHLVDLLRIVFQDAGNHIGYLWDYSSLSSELRDAGFAEVVRCEIGRSSDPDFRALEARSDEPESPITLVVEASKPQRGEPT